MALTGHAYFDAPESKLPGEPPAATWIAPISLKKAYQWEPAPDELTDSQKKFILGAHGCLWTDRFMHNPILQDLPVMAENRSARYVDYLSLPRMSALAEVVWTPKSLRSWDAFQQRMALQYNRYDNAGYNYRVPLPIVTKQKVDNGYTVTLDNPVNDATIRYTTDGTYPTVFSKIYTSGVKIDDPDQFSAITVVNNNHYSLAFKFPQSKNARFKKYGQQVGQWKSGNISAGTFKPLDIDATGKINANGKYELTFIYTGGTQRLDIQKVEVIVNGKIVASDKRSGTTGGTNKNNVYLLKIDNYETGANYTIRASVMGDTGSDSNGLVFIKSK